MLKTKQTKIVLLPSLQEVQQIIGFVFLYVQPSWLIRNLNSVGKKYHIEV